MAPHTRELSSATPPLHRIHPSVPPPRRSSPLDEGYSEPSQSQADGDEDMMGVDGLDYDAGLAKNRLLQLPIDQRFRVIEQTCESFVQVDKSYLFKLLSAINSRLFYDPVRHLPNELILQILSHLTPQELLNASLVSRSWRARTNDETLWRDCFAREGWIINKSAMHAHEDLAKRKGVDLAERVLRGSTLERKLSRKRQRDEAFGENESTAAQADVAQSEENTKDGADGMEGVEETAFDSGTSFNTERELPMNANHSGDTLMDENSLQSPTDHSDDFGASLSPGANGLAIQPPLFSSSKDPKVSWQYLYKQRRRLEKNWDIGKYTSFQLPHPDHEKEGHTECVYTIQYSGKWLVSGSRDKTIRIWDLDTCRLRTDPLIGHKQSVLCLQFDERPGSKHDIIISGGSDSKVILWRFSTGEHLRTIHQPHDESVLNLRFDDRYLITCSKDKTIKIWNRHTIHKEDSIIPMRVLPQFREQEAPMIPSLTLLDTLYGHHAAVNAVQIHGDTIISASGDRTIRAWEIHSGSSKKQYSGHTKGIACVQFDGRRVVSGSSDNSVRIFDYETQAEIAWLEGHTELVRTVQARFGDLNITSDEELHAQSRLADQRLVRTWDEGMPQGHASRTHIRSPASRRDRDFSIGTKVPSGGGGSKWAKIVSGSYDETVIIWKRGRDGKWMPNVRLDQSRLRNPGPGRQARHGAAPLPLNINAHQHNIQTQQVAQLPGMHGGVAVQIPGQPGHQIIPAHLNAVAIMQTHGNMLNQVANNQQQQPPPPAHQGTANQALPSNGGPQHAPPHPQQGQANATQQAGQPNQQNGNIGNQHAPTNQAPQAHSAQHQPAQNAHGPQYHHHAHQHHHHAGHHHHHHHNQANIGPGPPSRDTNRIFKLQFDTRRIIACSQDKKIVGWDFAAGEKDLEWVGDWSVETP